MVELEISDKLDDIRYKMQNNVPTHLLTHDQQQIFALQWVLEQIENIENEGISRQNNTCLNK